MNELKMLKEQPINLAALASLPEPVEVAVEQLDEATNINEAFICSWRMSLTKLSKGDAASILGIHRANFGGLIDGWKRISLDKVHAYDRVVGNTFVSQWVERDRQRKIAAIIELRQRPR